MKKPLLILGNGRSRLLKLNKINNFDGDVWACNRAYLEYKTFNHLDLIISVHNDEANKALIFKQENNLNYEIITQTPDKVGINKIKEYRGWSSGLEAVNEAINRCYKDIYLLGFCFVNGDTECIYTEGLITQNFFRQWEQILDSKPNCNFHFIK